METPPEWRHDQSAKRLTNSGAGLGPLFPLGYNRSNSESQLWSAETCFTLILSQAVYPLQVGCRKASPVQCGFVEGLPPRLRSSSGQSSIGGGVGAARIAAHRAGEQPPPAAGLRSASARRSEQFAVAKTRTAFIVRRDAAYSEVNGDRRTPSRRGAGTRVGMARKSFH